MSITLETLRTLRPGYTFTTTIATDSPMVSILVEGQRAGLGRLVAVGDRIGVQVTHWSTAGSTAGSNESTAATMPIVLEPATHG